jgi:hypothetical protein
MKKTINPCKDQDTGSQVFCSIKYENGRLSICGVVGPKKNGDAVGSCGQINGSFQARDYTEGWDHDTLTRFLEVWDRWHLNDMRAACEHQRKLGWTWETHPSVPCPECGYKLGSAWLFEAVPDDVIAFLESLPDSVRVPAWV